jgi:RNA polymerase sigma factor (sigma-70 family)
MIGASSRADVRAGGLPDMRVGVEQIDQRRRLEALFREHANPVHAYARRRSSSTVADDVVGEVFVIAWRRIDEVPDPALPWLLGCARRVLANQRRSERRASALRSRLAANQSRALPTDGGDEVLRRALNELRGRDREVLLLTAWEGLGPDEVATVLGCSKATMEVRLHRARRRLEAALAQIENERLNPNAQEILP